MGAAFARLSKTFLEEAITHLLCQNVKLNEVYHYAHFCYISILAHLSVHLKSSTVVLKIIKVNIWIS